MTTIKFTAAPAAGHKGKWVAHMFFARKVEGMPFGALGMKNSGAALQALTKLRSGLASQEHGNYLARISGLAGVGQNQVNQNNAASMNSALSQGQLMQDAGAARASGYVGGANAWTGALDNFGNTLGNWASYQPRTGSNSNIAAGARAVGAVG